MSVLAWAGLLTFWGGITIGYLCGYHRGRASAFNDTERIEAESREATKKRVEKPVYANYGHPHPPLRVMRNRLPTPPPGFAWESMIIHDANGSPWMHLTMMDLATGKAATTKSVHVGDPRWRERYREYPSLQLDKFNNDLIAPMIDWAIDECNRLAMPNKVVDYKLEQ